MLSQIPDRRHHVLSSRKLKRRANGFSVTVYQKDNGRERARYCPMCP